MNVKFAAALLAGLMGLAGAAAAQQGSSPQTPAPQTPSARGNRSQTSQNPPPPTHRIIVPSNLVHLVATVMNRHDGFITDLNQSDFHVFEDGQPQQIEFFERETDLPLRIALLLDTSNSIRPRLQFEQEAAIDFLTSVIRRGTDEAFLMTFDNEPEVIQDYTDDVGDLSDAIRAQRAGGGTALDDALFAAAQKLENAPPDPKGSDLRRVLVLISDGDDTLSDRAPSDAMEAILRAGAAVYSISTNTDWISVDDESHPTKYHVVEGDKVLQDFSQQTGGRVFFPYRVDDLAQSFTEIGSELRSQYLIAYRPAASSLDGRYHRIEVQTDRKGLVVRTKKGYYAIPAPRSSAGLNQ